jgi:hypothetical protein
VQDFYIALGTWHQALQSKKVLTQKSLALMNKPYTFIENWGHRCDYGVFLDQLYGKSRIYHHGGIKGFMSTMTRFPKKGVFICILGNFEKFDRSGMVSEIAKMIFGE